jgi:hypothetical protein
LVVADAGYVGYNVAATMILANVSFLIVAIHSMKLALRDFVGFVNKGEWMKLSN